MLDTHHSTSSPPDYIAACGTPAHDATPSVEDCDIATLITRATPTAPRQHRIATLVPYDVPAPPRPDLGEVRLLHEWQDACAGTGLDYAVAAVDVVADSDDDADAACAALSVALSRVCGATVVVAGAGSCDGRRMALTLMATSDDARAIAVGAIEAMSTLRLVGDRVIAAGDASADDYDATFANGCYVAWLDSATTADVVAAGVTAKGRVTH